MRITSFNPLIVAKDAAPVIALFEALGFEVRHTKNTLSSNTKMNVRMKDANGFYVDVAQSSLQLPQDKVTIRMNVDNLDEAYTLLQDHGFKNAIGENRIAETKTSRNAIMRSPSGFTIVLIQHIK